MRIWGEYLPEGRAITRTPSPPERKEITRMSFPLGFLNQVGKVDASWRRPLHRLRDLRVGPTPLRSAQRSEPQPARGFRRFRQLHVWWCAKIGYFDTSKIGYFDTSKIGYFDASVGNTTDGTTNTTRSVRLDSKCASGGSISQKEGQSRGPPPLRKERKSHGCPSPWDSSTRSERWTPHGDAPCIAFGTYGWARRH